jgi:hypothetical protein
MRTRTCCDSRPGAAPQTGGKPTAFDARTVVRARDLCGMTEDLWLF